MQTGERAGISLTVVEDEYLKFSSNATAVHNISDIKMTKSKLKACAAEHSRDSDYEEECLRNRRSRNNDVEVSGAAFVPWPPFSLMSMRGVEFLTSLRPISKPQLTRSSKSSILQEDSGKVLFSQ